MRLWRENRLDQEFEASAEDLASRFLDSRWSRMRMPVERSLATWMSHPEGLNATWDDSSDFQDVVEAVLTHRRED